MRTPARLAFFLLIPTLAATAALGGPKNEYVKQYKGKPFHDSHYQAGAQHVPGAVLCAYWDLGGEGVAFHAVAPLPAGAEPKLDSSEYLAGFRKDEPLESSYTRMNQSPPIDDSEFNLNNPPSDLPFVSRMQPGEWFNLTVDAPHEGDYTADLVYAAFHGGSLQFDVNGEPVGAPLVLRSTWNADDPMEWRQGHHWARVPAFVKLHLLSGRNVITVHLAADGQMNLAILEFK